MELPLRLTVANADVLEPLLVRSFSGSPRTNAMVRTTTAVTVIEGGVKENVLPSSARALVNFRILPGDSIESVTSFVRGAVDDPRVDVRVYEGRRGFSNEPSPESRVDSPAFALLARAIRASYPDTVVAPNLVLGGTDARWFRPLSDDVYRFGPLHVKPEDLKRVHGTNERIGVRDYLDSIRFYLRLLRAVE
jgi:carboxypeptidase PM20D1